MARGRHRHAPLHRAAVPTALGGLALLCAGASWLVGDAGGAVLTLRALVAGAALAALAAAVLLRRWDAEASRQVAGERAAKAGMVWRAEERQAELEEAQEQVGVLEERLRERESQLRERRAEVGRLRSEHAALLRRYATAESERAKALEGRRQLALEAAEPTKALPAQATDHRTAAGAPTPLTYHQAHEALGRLSRNAARQREERDARERDGRPAEGQQWPQPTPASAPGPAAEAPRPARPAAPQPGGGGFDFFGRGPRTPRSGQRAGADHREPATDGSDRAPAS